MPTLTKAMLKTLWPRAPQRTADAIVAAAPAVFRQFGLTTDLRVAHFMAQISHECGGGTIVRENMNYSAKRLMEIFGVGRHSARVTADEAQRLAHKPREIAERVYGLGNPKKARELGNTRPGDGFLFRGNGMLQLTGGGSHRRIGDLIGVDLYGNPGQLEDPATSFKVAAAEFKALNCLPAADADNTDLVTKRVNGGFNGLSDRKGWLRKWKAALEADAEEEDDAPEEKIEEALEADAEPRAAEPAPAKSLSESKIVKGAVTAGTATIPPAAGAVIQATGEDAAEAVAPTITERVTDVVDHAGTVISSTRTVIDAAPPVPPSLWRTIAHLLTDPVVIACFALVALAAIGYVIWERRRKLREEGV